MFEDGPHTAEAQERILAEVLALPVASSQDWGIENGNPGRLDEFIDFFEREDSGGWDEGTVGGYVDLVLQSANQRLEQDPHAAIDGALAFLKQVGSRAAWATRYWRSLTATRPDPWPIASYLRSHQTG